MDDSSLVKHAQLSLLFIWPGDRVWGMQQHQIEIHFLTLVRAYLHAWAALYLACCWKLYFLLLLFFFYEWIRGGAVHLHHELDHV